MVILERDDDPGGRRLGSILRNIVRSRATLADVEALREIANAQPDDPLPWKLLGALAPGIGATAEGVDAWHRAAALDPGDAASLERAAELLLDAGRSAEAAVDLQRARQLRDSPAIRRSMRQLESDPGGGVVRPIPMGNTAPPAESDRNDRP
jgi:predicted Zn-dependent protease